MGDYSAYREIFVTISNLGLRSALEWTYKDPLFYTLFWCLAHTNFAFAVFVITFLAYGLFFRAAFNFGFVSNGGFMVLSALLIVWPFFSLSAHIMRQFLAMSFVFYGFSLQKTRVMYKLLWYFFALLTHTSTLAVLLLLVAIEPSVILRGRRGFLVLCAAPLMMYQVNNLTQRLVLDTIDDGTILTNTGFNFAVVSMLLALLLLLTNRKSKVVLGYFIFSVFSLILLQVFNPFLFGRYQFYTYGFILFVFATQIRINELLGTMTLLGSLIYTAMKLNTSGYNYSFAVENLFFFYL